MSARPIRNERERRLLESLLRAIGLDASISDRESPDFTVLSDGRLVGVEVTELKPILYWVFFGLGAGLAIQALFTFEILRFSFQGWEKRIAGKRLGRKL